VPAIIEEELSEDDEILRIIASNQTRVTSKDERKKEIEFMRTHLKNKGETQIDKRIAELFGISERTLYRSLEEDKEVEEQLELDDENLKKEKLAIKINKLIKDIKKHQYDFSKEQINTIQRILVWGDEQSE
jgi:hypothetical protein